MLRLPLVVAFLSLLHLSSALYFYLDAGENRCFLEELPKDTIVVGRSHFLQLYSSARGQGDVSSGED